MNEEIFTVKELVRSSTEKFSKCVAYRMKRDEKYREWTFSDVGKFVKNLGGALSDLQVKAGDKVLLLSENRPEWPISYLSIASLGAIVVPLDALLQARDLLYLIKDSGAGTLILSQKFIDLLDDNLKEADNLKTIISMDAKEDKKNIISWDRLTREEKSAKEEKVLPDDLLAIIYTSGTTGVSKGVMLSHKNVMSNVQAARSLFEIGPGDRLLSVLPIHHTFETTGGFLTPYYVGASVTYAESLKSYNLLQNMQDIKLTIMLGVPLLYQLFLDGIMRGVEEKGGLAKIIFKVLFFISAFVKTVFRVNIGRKLFSMVHKKLGGQVRFWVSGGAAIDPKVIKSFDLMGLTILQGYGLTESSPVLCACSIKENRIGSVGKQLPGVEVKIDKPNRQGIGEIIARGPNIMKGYYKNPEATSEILKGGWLYTGDMGYIDRDGYVFITGRSKYVIVTGSGLNVYPEEVEVELNRSPFIKESCVLSRKVKVGARKGTEEVFAVIFPDMEYFVKVGKTKKLGVDQNFIKTKIRVEIKRINDKLPDYKKIGGFELRSEEFPKTSTKKIKRFVVKKEYGL